MLSFDAKDFTKSAFSLATGMSLVVLIVSWHSQGDISAICLTGGLPIGVLSFWALYALKMKAAKQRQAFLREQSSVSPMTELSEYQRLFGNVDRRTIPGFGGDAIRHRILQGREGMPIAPQDKAGVDQWHQG